MDDYEIREFKNSIINYMNTVPLPMEVKRLVLSDIYHETAKAAEESIKEILRAEKDRAHAESDGEKSPE